MKLIDDIRYANYELTFLVDATLVDSERLALEKKLLTLIEKHQGKVLEKQDWGKKSLAYSIKHKGKVHKEALFGHWLVRFQKHFTQSFNQDLRLSQFLIRSLLVAVKDIEGNKIQVSSGEQD